MCMYSVAIWLDAGNVNDGAVARKDDDVIMTDARASSTPGALWIARAGTGVFVIPTDSSYVVDRQGARNVLAFGDTFPGMTGTWGPLAGRWTVVLFVQLNRLVNDYGTFLGNGSGIPYTVLSSSTVTIDVPVGGSVPAGALRANGGPLDGVDLGAPWDVPFLSALLFKV